MKILVIASWKSNFFHREAKAIQGRFNYSIDLVYLRNNKKFQLRNILLSKNDSNDWKDVEGVKCSIIDFYQSDSDCIIKRYLCKLFNRLNFSFVRKNNYSLIHLQSLNPAALLIYDLQYYLKKTPYIFTEHNQFSLRGFGLKDQQKIIKIIRNSNRRLVVSKDKIRQFAANGIHTDCYVIGNCIDPVYEELAPNIERDDFGILHVGAFDPYKDQKTLFEALKLLDIELKLSGRKINFTWLGYDGWGTVSEKQVEKFIEGYKFKNINVLIEPFTYDFETLKKKYQANGLYVLSSVSEGLSVAMLEAMACGMYVISTRCGGSEDVINDENGNLVPIQDPKVLAKAICDYVFKSQTINRLKISNNILNNFQIDTFALKLKEQYDYAINNNQ